MVLLSCLGQVKVFFYLILPRLPDCLWVSSYVNQLVLWCKWKNREREGLKRGYRFQVHILPPLNCLLNSPLPAPFPHPWHALLQEPFATVAQNHLMVTWLSYRFSGSQYKAQVELVHQIKEVCVLGWGVLAPAIDLVVVVDSSVKTSLQQ